MMVTKTITMSDTSSFSLLMKIDGMKSNTKTFRQFCYWHAPGPGKRWSERFADIFGDTKDIHSDDEGT